MVMVDKNYKNKNVGFCGAFVFVALGERAFFLRPIL